MWTHPTEWPLIEVTSIDEQPAPVSTTGPASGGSLWRGAVMVGGAAGLLAVAHAAPAAAAIGPLRRVAWPAYAGQGDLDHVALTFDDGPHRLSTPHFLEALDDHTVRATFFVLGSSVARVPSLAREMAVGGHELAVHGWEHRLLIRRPPEGGPGGPPARPRHAR